MEKTRKFSEAKQLCVPNPLNVKKFLTIHTIGAWEFT